MTTTDESKLQARREVGALLDINPATQPNRAAGDALGIGDAIVAGRGVGAQSM